MRIPANPDQPSFDDTYKVGFWRWFTSNKADRKEWQRRRNAAIPTSRSHQVAQRIEQSHDQHFKPPQRRR